MATALTYTLKEVNSHQGRESCWIVIDGKVYDVTKYLDQHPGGDEEILNEAGTNATEAFNSVPHSSDAKEILETLLIGYLHADDIRALASNRYSIPWPWARIPVAVAVVPIIALAITSVFILLKRK